MKKNVDVWIHENGKWEGYTTEEYLKIKVNYKWNDIVTMAIERDISVRRMLVKLMKSGDLVEINSTAVEQLVFYIRHEIARL